MKRDAVFIVSAPPNAVLIASLGRAIEPLIGAPQSVEAPRIGRIGVVNGAVLDREGAHAWSIAHECSSVGPARFREPRDGLRNLRRCQRMITAPIIVLNAAFALLFLGDGDVEIEVEVVAERGRPRERPPHPALVL